MTLAEAIGIAEARRVRIDELTDLANQRQARIDEVTRIAETRRTELDALRVQLAAAQDIKGELDQILAAVKK